MIALEDIKSSVGASDVSVPILSTVWQRVYPCLIRVPVHKWLKRSDGLEYFTESNTSVADPYEDAHGEELH